MLRPLIITLCCAALLTCIVGIARQRQQLAELRAEQNRAPSEAPLNSEPANSEPTPIVPDASPSLELLRLRSEVTKLKQQKDELAAVEEQHEALKSKLANKPKGLPEGYIRKSEAKMKGYNSPADTLQTFLWAVQNTNLTVFLDSLTPMARKQIQEQIERNGAAEFFRQSETLPGMRITSQEPVSPMETVLGVEVIPGEPLPEKIHVLLVNGQWKLKMD